MSDSTLHFQWIARIQGNLDAHFRDEPDVLVVSNLLWYAVRGEPTASIAPETMVVFGRPKGYRESYMQWREDDIAPQVVFVILSLHTKEENDQEPVRSRFDPHCEKLRLVERGSCDVLLERRQEEMERKHAFCERHGTEESYFYDPDRAELFGWLRRGRRLRPIAKMDGWISPRLAIRFDLSHQELVIYKENGQPFLSFAELAERAAELRHQAELALRQAAREKRQREKAEQEAERLRQKLRDLGVNPDDLEDTNR